MLKFLDAKDSDARNATFVPIRIKILLMWRTQRTDAAAPINPIIAHQHSRPNFAWQFHPDIAPCANTFAGLQSPLLFLIRDRRQPLADTEYHESHPETIACNALQALEVRVNEQRVLVTHLNP